MTAFDDPTPTPPPAEVAPGSLAGHRRRELAEFLRTRRSRLRPEDIGLPPGVRRRTPGLRREEVAQDAGVGVTWYTWLEQGRPIKASEQVLDAVARALRLDDAEREHMYQLADLPVKVSTSPVRAVSPAISEVLARAGSATGVAGQQPLGFAGQE